MKTKFIVLTCTILISCFCKAQDLIVTNEGDSLNCTITKETQDNIHFTFKFKEEVRNTLLPIKSIASVKKGYYSKSEVKSDEIIYIKTHKPLRFAINLGYSYHTAKLSDNIPSDFKEYAEKLKKGFHIGAELNHYFSESTGAGFKYYFYKSSNSMDNIYVEDNSGNRRYGKMSDEIRINFIGPLFSTRFYNYNKQNCYLMNLSIGYLGYKNMKTLVDEYEIKGGTVGLSLDIGYDWGISDKMAIGFQISLIRGALTKYEVSNGITTETVELEKGEYESLHRIDFSVGIRF